jgi:hypothetical protein
VFLVELQEPEDLSILLELRGFELDGEWDGHLGLGFDLALQAVECRIRSSEEIRQLVRPAGFGPSVLPEAADPYFRLEHVTLRNEARLDPGFAVLVMLNGEIDLALRQQEHGHRRSPIKLDPATVQIFTLPAMVNSGVYKKPLPFSGMGKPVKSVSLPRLLEVDASALKVDLLPRTRRASSIPALLTARTR